MIVTTRMIFSGFFALLLAAGLIATGLWIVVTVLFVGLLVWIAVALGGPAAH